MQSKYPCFLCVQLSAHMAPPNIWSLWWQAWYSLYWIAIIEAKCWKKGGNWLKILPPILNLTKKVQHWPFFFNICLQNVVPDLFSSKVLNIGEKQVPQFSVLSYLTIKKGQEFFKFTVWTFKSGVQKYLVKEKKEERHLVMKDCLLFTCINPLMSP